MAILPDTSTTDRFHTVLDICAPYVVGAFDLTERGGPRHTVVVKARSAAHVRKLTRRAADLLGAVPEGEAPDGTEPWLLVDGGEIVVHLLTETSLQRYGLVDLFADGSEAPSDVFAVVMMERLQALQQGRESA
jgi:ribosomal silencing factor RsfS